jgi:hypothetical protein
MSSSIRVISENVFPRCKSRSSATFETGSHSSPVAMPAFCESCLASIHLPAYVTVIGASCFSCCGSLASITFESGSRLSRLAKEVFSESGLTSIHLPASVTFIGEFCFSGCGSLASITFDPASKFRGSEADLLAGVRLGVTEARWADAFFEI